MHRIAPKNDMPEHREAIHYLNSLVLDLKCRKLRIVGELPHQVGVDRLAEWETIRRELIGCLGLNDGKFSEDVHANARDFFDKLVMQAKRGLEECGQPEKYVSIEALEQAYQQYNSLGGCRRQIICY